MKTRRAYLDITYQGVSITTDIADDLLSFIHNDNASQTADDITITLKDNRGKWIRDWFPEKGHKLKAVLVLENWNSEGTKEELPLGTFIIDAPEYQLSPSQLDLKGVSIPNSNNFTDDPVSKGWNKIKLKEMISQIAAKHGLTLLYDSQVNPQIERIDQNELSDMNFIADLAKKYGLAYKVSDEQIIIYSQAEYEQKPPVVTVKRTGGVVISGSLRTAPTYTGVKVNFTPPKTGKQVSATFGTTEKLFEVNQSAQNQAEAEQMAKAKLRELNKESMTAELTLVGMLQIVAGVVIKLEDFGKFDGNYFVDKVTQTLPNFSINVSAHKALEGGY